MREQIGKIGRQWCAICYHGGPSSTHYLEVLRQSLKAEQSRRHITLDHVAQESGVSIATLSRFVRELHTPSTVTIARIQEWVRQSGGR